MVGHCDRVFRISLTVRRGRICRGCRGVGKHLFYDTTKDEFMPERTLIPKWRLMALLLVLPLIKGFFAPENDSNEILTP